MRVSSQDVTKEEDFVDVVQEDETTVLVEVQNYDRESETHHRYDNAYARWNRTESLEIIKELVRVFGITTTEIFGVQTR